MTPPAPGRHRVPRPRHSTRGAADRKAFVLSSALRRPLWRPPPRSPSSAPRRRLRPPGQLHSVLHRQRRGRRSPPSRTPSRPRTPQPSPRPRTRAPSAPRRSPRRPASPPRQGREGPQGRRRGQGRQHREGPQGRRRRQGRPRGEGRPGGPPGRAAPRGQRPRRPRAAAAHAARVSPTRAAPPAHARRLRLELGQFGCLDSLWTKESGWSSTPSNASSGAYGIPQALPGSKMAAAGSDWQTNPATQIKWGLQLHQGRYGSPCAAWSHSQAGLVLIGPAPQRWSTTSDPHTPEGVCGSLVVPGPVRRRRLLSGAVAPWPARPAPRPAAPR